MNQQLLTHYFKPEKTPKPMSVNLKRKSLSLKKSHVSFPTKSKDENTYLLKQEEMVIISERKSLSLKKSHVSPMKRKDENTSIVKQEEVVIISDDDDLENSHFSSNIAANISQSSSGSDTIILEPETPKKTAFSSCNSAKTYSSPTSTPSPLKRTKFYSPNSKHLKVKRFDKFESKSASSRQLFFNKSNEEYNKLSAGLDDSTKFLLKIVYDFLQEESLKKLLSDQLVHLLESFLKLPQHGKKLIHSLYWRKDSWFKFESIKSICSGDKNIPVEDSVAAEMVDVLKTQDFLFAESDMSFQELVSLLKREELLEICKELKLKAQSKALAVESLEEYCKTTPISSFFTKNPSVNNEQRVLNAMKQKVGVCYKLSNLARGALERLYILTYLGIDYDVIREKRLGLLLINEKISIETYPVDKHTILENASIVFNSKEEFDQYMLAHCLREDFLTRTKPTERCNIVIQVYNLYKAIPVDCIIRYKSLYPWLQRFTPVCIYIKILEDGLLDLKRDKCKEKYVLAVEILDSLIAQNFRERKKANWYAEKALILHAYLGKHEEAAKTLICGFESNLSEIAKDAMRPRAKKIAQQKNITLDESIRHTLAKFADKDDILESNIPARHFFKQPMETWSEGGKKKGKVVYETKDSFGRTMQGVEAFARSSYIISGEFTHGDHWEGRIVKTIFFLLFWDIIYTKPKNTAGIFLSYLQQFPLDMFYPEFYSNRRQEIESNLKFIENCSIDVLIEEMNQVWQSRPESELSGIDRSIGWDKVSMVSSCLGPAGLAALCRPLATNYGYMHSGFPDLTMWNTETKRIMFVEVKSDSDQPSLKQIQWMNYLMENNIETEFCYVGVNNKRIKSRSIGRVSVPNIEES